MYRVGSLAVHSFMARASTAVVDKWSITATTSAGTPSLAVVTGWGSLLKASALQRRLPDLYLIV